MNKLEQRLEIADSDQNIAYDTHRPFWMVARDILAKFKPSFGLPSLDHHIYGWKRSANIIVAGRHGTGASSLALTLAENFASNIGPVIWIGCGDDLRPICERLIFRDAGLEIGNSHTVICLDDAGKQAANKAYLRIIELPIEFCNIDQCVDAALEQKFLAAVTSDKPSLIVVEPSVFDEAGLNPFEVLTRRCLLFRMISELKLSNPDWRVLWQLPVTSDEDLGDSQILTIDHLDEPTIVGSADVIMFTHFTADASSPTNAELIIVKNCFGSVGTIPLQYEAALSTWRECDDVK